MEDQSSRPVRVTEPLTGRVVHLAPGRRRRPPAGDGCPFCPGGAEVPGSFANHAFPNRFSPLPPGRAEVVVHGPGHDRDFASLPLPDIEAVVRLWVARSRTLGLPQDVETVLVFENRGRAAGASMDHPHSQIFALPDRVRLPSSDGCPVCAGLGAGPLVRASNRWVVSAPQAQVAPFTLRLAPRRHVRDLSSLDTAERMEFVGLLQGTVRALDAQFGEPMPYQLWTAQATGGAQAGAHLTVEMAGLLRAPGRAQLPGAAELATGALFVSADPYDVADRVSAAWPQYETPEGPVTQDGPPDSGAGPCPV